MTTNNNEGGPPDEDDQPHAGRHGMHGFKLNVQGAVLTFEKAVVSVREALEKAGFDITKNWIIIFKTKDDPKRQVTLDDPLDLSAPGVEKLRVTPATINNGEAPQALRRHFVLLEKDEAFLNATGWRWETVIEGEKRWLLIHNFELPAGYDRTHVTIAVLVAEQYPEAHLDSFYCAPASVLRSGGALNNVTPNNLTIGGVQFQFWSRHRTPANQWDSTTDCVATHLGLVEQALAREVR